MNILIIGSDKPDRIQIYSKKHIVQIKKIIPKARVTLTDDPATIKKVLPETEIIICSPVGFSLDLSVAKKLKWIHATSAGVTNLAPLLASTDVILTNSSGVHPIPIAEHVAGFMLMFARQFIQSYKTQILDKKWDRNVLSLPVFELNGRTVGIVGFGKIGKQIAKISKGMGMKVVVLEHSKKVVRGLVHGTYKDVNKLLAVSDFVIDCLPLTPETRGYFDIAKFKQFKPSAYFINIGRGKTVVEKDLVKALKEKIIAGAGLDVLEEEPTPDSNPLWKMDNVIITPHYSGWTPEYTNRVIDIFCQNLRAFLSHKPQANMVDKKRGY